MGKDVLQPNHTSFEYQSKAYTAAQHFLDAFLLPRLERASVGKTSEVEQLSYLFLHRNPQFIETFHLTHPLNLALQRLRQLETSSLLLEQAHDLLAEAVTTPYRD